MTPKEKAIDLYEKFIFPCWECDEFARAKECALIAVDELIYETQFEVPNIRQRYLKDVKQEIELL
jgi:hypothetical protein